MIYWPNILQDISWWVSGKESAWNVRDEIGGFDPWDRKIWSRAWQPTPVLLPGECMDRGAWWTTVHRFPGTQKTEATERTCVLHSTL